MNKEEFLERLREKLSILDEKEVKDIIDEYSEYIDEKTKKGVSEEDAIKEFGNINELVDEILCAYKVNKNYTRSKVDNFVDDVIDTAKEVFDKIIKIFSHGTAREVGKLIIYALVLIFVVAIIKIPFEFLESIMKNVFDVLPDPISSVFNVLITIIMNLVYMIIAFIIFFKMLKEKLLNSYVFEDVLKSEKETEHKKSTKSSSKDKDVVIERRIERKVVYKNERTFFDSIGDLFIFCLKIMSAMFLIPSIMGIVASAVGIAMLIVFAFEYHLFVGLIMICLGVLIGSSWITEIIFRFISNKSSSFLRLLITFIISLILCGAGVGISFIEYTNINYEEYNETAELLDKYSVDIDDETNVQCSQCSTVTKEVDETIENGKIIIYAYGYDFQNLGYSLTDSSEIYGNDELYVYFDIDNYMLAKKVFDYFKKDKYYNYLQNSEYIKIVGSEETLQKIKIEEIYY